MTVMTLLSVKCMKHDDKSTQAPTTCVWTPAVTAFTASKSPGRGGRWQKEWMLSFPTITRSTWLRWAFKEPIRSPPAFAETLSCAEVKTQTPSVLSNTFRVIKFTSTKEPLTTPWLRVTLKPWRRSSASKEQWTQPLCVQMNPSSI